MYTIMFGAAIVGVWLLSMIIVPVVIVFVAVAIGFVIAKVYMDYKVRQKDETSETDRSLH